VENFSCASTLILSKIQYFRRDRGLHFLSAFLVLFYSVIYTNFYVCSYDINQTYSTSYRTDLLVSIAKMEDWCILCAVRL